MTALPDFRVGQRQLSERSMDAMVDAIKELQRKVDDTGNDDVSSIISVHNISTKDLRSGEILGLGDSHAKTDDPSFQSEIEFRRSIVIEGDIPDIALHIGMFCVLLEGIAADDFGRAVIYGAAVCKVNMNNKDDKYAEILDDDETKLDSTPIGTARIQWVDPSGDGTGEKFAVVILGDTTPRVVELTAAVSGGTVTLKSTDSLGDIQGGEVTLTVLP